MSPKFTAKELEYLDSQTLGRLATVDPSGALQNNPVGFRVDEATRAGHHRRARAGEDPEVSQHPGQPECCIRRRRPCLS